MRNASVSERRAIAASAKNPACVKTLFLAVLLLAVTPTPAPHPLPERTPLLNDNVAPISYDLRIAPQSWTGNGGTADGEETVVVNVRHATSSIEMNAVASMTFSVAQIDGSDARISKFPIAQQISLSATSPIPAGKHTVHLRFKGRIEPDAAGLWPDNLTPVPAPNLVTLFEPSRARSLFPCFDEPRFRATFHLSAVAPSSWTVVSNMPVESTAPVADKKSVTTFQTTPPIPPYLLTLDMGVFTAIRGNAGTTPVTVYIRHGQEAIAKTVLADAQQSLAFYERDLGVAYPMPKLDIVVASGVLNDTMEGLGAITIFTEFDVSGGQVGGGVRGRQEAFNYIAQPIAQQWFGGNVGIAAWNESWLTNALGSWAEYRAARHLHPEFGVYPPDIDWAWNAFSLWGSVDPLRKSFNDDRDPASFNSLMASATDSGQAVLDQWNAYIGDARMRAGVERYLHDFAGKAATSADFWQSFGSGEAVAYGDRWLNQPGAPVVAETLQCPHGTERITFAQEPARSDYFKERRGASWPIPISLTANGKATWTVLTDHPVTLEGGACAASLLTDAGLRPPFLLHQDLRSLDALAQSTTLAPVDRLRILRDTSTLFHGNAATLPEFLAAIRIGATKSVLDLSEFGLRFDLENVASALRESPYESMFAKSLNASLLRVVSNATHEGGASAHRFDPYYTALAYSPEKARARELLLDWRKSQRGDFAVASVQQAIYAGSVATTNDIDFSLAHLNENKNLYYTTDPAYLLEGLRQRASINRILGVLAVRRVDYPSMIWAIGKREPSIIADYVEQHARDILRTVPPTQQAMTLTFGVADGPWAGRTPAQWRAFFERTLPARDEPTIHAAMLLIEKQWDFRHRLESQLAATRSTNRRLR